MYERLLLAFTSSALHNASLASASMRSFFAVISKVRYAYNLAIPEGWSLATSHDAFVRENIISGDVGVDDDYRPMLSSVAVDSADSGYRSGDMPDADLLGGQRIYNGKMDIGALEADWRAAYAATIAPSDSRFAVRSADPSVTLSGNGTISIPDGASVLLAWRGFGAGKYIRYRLRFNVSPGAVLAAEVNGDETICGTPGEQELEFMSSLVSNDVVLAARGGTIELAGCAADRGFSVHIR